MLTKEQRKALVDAISDQVSIAAAVMLAMAEHPKASTWTDEALLKAAAVLRLPTGAEANEGAPIGHPGWHNAAGHA